MKTNTKTKENKHTEEIKEAKIEEKEENKEKEVKKEPQQDNKYASFWQRLCAFIIDSMLIGIIISLVTQPLINNNNLDKLSKELNEVITQYTNQKITMKTYVSKVADIEYDISREGGLSSIIGIAIAVLYYVVYQFKANGQTLGKKLMKIKIVKKGKGELTINDMLFRSLIINSILFNILSVCCIFFLSKDVYFYAVSIIEFIQYIVIFISCLMILSNKDRQGIHDLVAHTEVVKA